MANPKRFSREYAVWDQMKREVVDKNNLSINPYRVIPQILGRKQKPSDVDLADTYELRSNEKKPEEVIDQYLGHRGEAIDEVNKDPTKALSYVKGKSLQTILLEVNPVEIESDMGQLHGIARNSYELDKSYKEGNLDIGELSKQELKRKMKQMIKDDVRPYTMKSYETFHKGNPERLGSKIVQDARSNVNLFKEVIGNDEETAHKYLTDIWNNSGDAKDNVAEVISRINGNSDLEAIAKRIEKKRKAEEAKAE